MDELSLLSAFIVGLLGTGHCFGMCGGLISAFSGQIPYRGHGSRLQQELTYLCKYNSGRLVSYSVAGIVCGALSGGLGLLFNLDQYLIVLRIVAGLMMVAVGLYVAQLWQGVLLVERLGQGLWRQLQPLTQRYLPQPNDYPFTAGLIWGWLPCGLVYSMLTWSVASGNAWQGGLIMLAFGLGTLPALLSLGLLSQKLKSYLQQRYVRVISGLFVIGLGGHTIVIGVLQL